MLLVVGAVVGITHSVEMIVVVYGIAFVLLAEGVELGVELGVVFGFSVDEEKERDFRVTMISAMVVRKKINASVKGITSFQLRRGRRGGRAGSGGVIGMA